MTHFLKNLLELHFNKRLRTHQRHLLNQKTHLVEQKTRNHLWQKEYLRALSSVSNK